MRKVIAGLKISLDGKVEGPQGYADWVEAWSEDYGLTPHLDAVIIGGGMYPHYEQYWTAIRERPEEPHWLSGNVPTPAEVEWARVTRHTPHYVLSRTVTQANWPQTRFLRGGLDDVAALKAEAGKDVYLMGGARITNSLIGAGLLDELRLITYPVISGEGKALFSTSIHHRDLNLLHVEQLAGGCVGSTYLFAS